MCKQHLGCTSGILLAMNAQTKAFYRSNMRNTSGQTGLTLDKLKSGLPILLQKDLVQAIKLVLSRSEKLLLDQYLQFYLNRVEFAIGGLSDKICVVELCGSRIMQLRPLVLRDSIWDVLKITIYDSISDLRSAV